MKKFFTALCVLTASAGLAQTTFWTENFGTGCNRGQLATAYSGSNGAWTQTLTGTNQTYANIWFVSAAAANTGANQCVGHCQVSPSMNSQSLHIGNPAFTIFNTSVGADSAATYLTGTFCGFNVCSTTDKRVESPTINCTGYQNITVSFLYFEGGQTTIDDATFWYYNGTAWAQADALAKTVSSCSPYPGTWTSISINLPASADNNANVKIGFRWVSNDDGTGSDPSFAVDDIAVAGSIISSADGSNFPGLNVYSNLNNVYITGVPSFKVRSVYNVVGQNVQFSNSSSQITVHSTPGVYFVELEIEGKKVTRKVSINQ